MKKGHIDYFAATNKLLHAVYRYNDDDYEKLIAALKAGTVSGEKYSDDDIANMKKTKTFRQRYDKFLRKEIRSVESMRLRLDEWYHRFKCTTSNPDSPAAQGRLDPRTQQTLFSPETKVAWLNCKDKAEHLQDPLPLHEMYDTIPPNPNSTHGLNEYLSKRGESGLPVWSPFICC